MLDPSRNELPDFFRQVIFPAKITAATLASDGTTWLYDWTEQRISGDGSLTDAESSRKGEAASFNAAREINNQQLIDFPTFVWIRLRGGDRQGNTVYEFTAGGGASPSILAQITGKCYRDGSGCEFDEECSDRNILYWWVRVEESEDPCALTYAEQPDSGGPGCYPLYHVRDLNLPVYAPGSPRSANASTAEDSDASGSVAWTSPENVTASDDSYATATLSAGAATHYLKVSFPCLGIPPQVTVTDIKLSVEALASGGDVVDVEVKLTVNGAVSGTSQHTGVALGTTDAVRDYDHTLASWGITLNPTDTLGAAIRYGNSAGSERTVSVDRVSVEVTFEPAGFIGQRKSIFRIWRGAGDYYLFDGMPSVEHIYRTESEDADGVISYHLERDQNDQANKLGREVRLVLPSEPV